MVREKTSWMDVAQKRKFILATFIFALAMIGLAVSFAITPESVSKTWLLPSIVCTINWLFQLKKFQQAQRTKY